MGNVTMKDLARELGVSVTTVSNAYSHPDRLSEKLRAKILQRGEEMGYCGPDAVGRLLRSGRAGAIGVLTGKGYSFAFRDQYTVMMLEALAHELEKRGIALSLLPSGVDEDNIDAVANAVVDGIVSVSSRTDSPVVQFARKRGLRVIYGFMDPDEEFVAGDDFTGGHLLGEYVARAGHKNVAVVHLDHTISEPFVTTDMNRFCPVHTQKYWGRTRAEGIREALGPAVNLQLVVLPGDIGYEDLSLDYLLSLDPQPTVLMCLSDRMALNLMEKMRDRGMEPGVDLSITGYDGIELAIAEGLCTIKQPIAEKGRQTALLMLDENPTERQIVLPVELFEGRTVGPPKI